MSNDVYIVEAYDQDGTLTFHRGYLTGRVAQKHFDRLVGIAACVSLSKNFVKVREMVNGAETEAVAA